MTPEYRLLGRWMSGCVFLNTFQNNPCLPGGASRRPPSTIGMVPDCPDSSKKIYAFWSYIVVIPISAILAPMKIRNVCLDIDFALIPCW